MPYKDIEAIQGGTVVDLHRDRHRQLGTPSRRKVSLCAVGRLTYGHKHQAYEVQKRSIRTTRGTSVSEVIDHRDESDLVRPDDL